MSEQFVPISWAGLKSLTSQCQLCKLCTSRTNVVFGEGTNQARVVFVGEGPGQKEDEQGRPFVGRAGAELTVAIEKCLHLSREEVYICNVVKCRPPKNRNPEDDEIKQCLPYLHRQLEIINPEVIVTLGNVPKKSLTGIEEGITKVRGDWVDWRGIPVMLTYHPAYILRSPDKSRPLFEQDLIKVANRLEALTQCRTGQIA